MDEFFGFVCIGALFVVGSLVAVIVVLLRGRGGRAADATQAAAIRDLTSRVVALERQVDALRGVSPGDARQAAPPAPVPERPRAQVPAPRPAVPEAPTPAPTPAAPPSDPWAATPPPLPASAPPSPQPDPAPPTPVHSAAARPAAPARAKPELSLEVFLGSRVMLVVGVIVGLLGVAYFLKYMIDQGWITPGWRVAMGIAAGLGLLAGGDVLRRRGFDVFGQALMGFGLGAVYLSNYFASSIYDLIGPTAAFALAAAITAAGAALAVLRNAPVLAYLGFLGGYLAPALLSTSSGDLVGLTTWLLVLDVGLLAVLLRRAWHGLDLFALLATSVYVAVWFDRHAAGARLGTASACLGALAAMSLALGLARPLVRRERPTAASLGGVAVAGALAVIGGHALLFPAERSGLAAGVALLGAAYVGAAVALAKRVEGARAATESLFAFAAATFATAVAVAASGNAVSPALSAAGVAIVFAGARTKHPALLACGVGAIGLAVGDLLVNRIELYDAVAAPFLNERFFVFACPCLALLAAGRILAKAEGVDASLAALVGAAGLVVLPVVMAADLFRSFGAIDPFQRELRYVAPAAALAVYAVLAARLFDRRTAIGRAAALAPLVFSFIAGLTLLTGGHVRDFTVLVNPTFLAGLLVVAAARVGPAEGGAKHAFSAMGVLFLVALVTAELHAWGERSLTAGEEGRALARFAARNWIVIAWSAFATALAFAEAARRRRFLAWVGTGAAAADRPIAVMLLAGAAMWNVAGWTDWESSVGWLHGSAVHRVYPAFGNMAFAAAMCVVAAAHAVGRAPFDTPRRVVRLLGLAHLLAALTVEIHAGGYATMPPHTIVVLAGTSSQLGIAAWSAVTWSLFAAAIAWMGAARRVPGFGWLGVDDEVLETRAAVVPLLGAVIWGIETLAAGHGKALPIFVNVRFGAALVVGAAAFAAGLRSRTALRDWVHGAAVLWGLAILTAEIHAWGDTCAVGTGTRADAEFRAIVWISVTWAAYAAALVGVGFARRHAALRWMGLGVFALTLGKVFLVDLARLEAVYRIGSFMALGVLLVAASFLYQRARRSEPPTS